jgi:4-phospho-D-threonate 3-dehydrogenase / 4-phospho-D-erythronate 3-dehydrogenase
MVPLHKPLLALTMGDPSGIGPEIVVKALQHPRVRRTCRPVVVGQQAIFERTIKSLGASLVVVPVAESDLSDCSRSFRKDRLPLFDPLPPLSRPIPMGRPSAQGGEMAVRCIQSAVRFAQTGKVSGIVTAPINKEGMHLAGHYYPGHTELLAELTNTRESGMMIMGGPLKIVFTTTHLPLRDVAANLTAPGILRAIRLGHFSLQRLFGIAKPRIAVAAFNPHAGEHGLFGDEERRLILPAIKRAKGQGIDCSGPHPADTMFAKALSGAFDGIVALYHDQGLIPLKTVAFGHCVNITVGLPILRTSVDHGTAYDIAGQGKADPTSLVDAIMTAVKLAPAFVSRGGRKRTGREDEA